LADVKPSELDPRHYLFYKQLVCLAKMWFEKDETMKSTLDFSKIYQKFMTELSPEKREDFINEDPATKSNEQAVAEI
jgi:hypothetical protein